MNCDQLFEYAKKYCESYDASRFPDQPAIYTAEITGEGGGVFSVEVKNGRLYPQRGALSGAKCGVVLSVETASALISGRLKPQIALATGKIKVRGDISSLLKLASFIM